MLRGLTRKQALQLEEVRIRLGQPTELVVNGRSIWAGNAADEADMEQLLCALSGRALYRFEQQMAEGYIPLPGGHRAGLCGRMVRREDRTWRMADVSSVCIRIARHIEGASAAIRVFLFTPAGRARRVLLLGAPGCGKTTVLRDAALYLAKSMHVAVVDEREELFAQRISVPQTGMDVLAGVDKVLAFSMLIRSMAPQVVICDELGREEDVQAVLDAARCGVGVLASAHADGFDDLLRRPMMRKLFDAGAFERYIHLGHRASVLAVWDEVGREMVFGEEGMHGELGHGGDGDDWREQHRFFSGRWRAKACEMDSGDAALPDPDGRDHPL